jgi:ferredoxin
MTHLVTDDCINCKYTDCVVVCPVDCFFEGPNFLAISPDECIDCGVCIPECPVGAIVQDDDLPELERKQWLDINTELAAKWPNITKRKEPLPSADEWAKNDNKLIYLQKE